MAPSRAFIPSRALLRSLSGPLPRQCLIARRIHTTPILRKRPKAAKPPVTPKPPNNNFENDTLNDSGLSKISFYEQDSSGRTPERLISEISSAEELKKFQGDYNIMEAAEAGGDDTEYKKRLLDDLMRNPEFGDSIEGLKAMRTDLNGADDVEEISKIVQEMLADPTLDPKDRKELLGMQNRLPEILSEGEEEEEELLSREIERLNEMAATIDNPDLQERLSEAGAKTAARSPDEILTPGSETDPANDLEVDPLISEMHQLMTLMGTDPKLRSQLADLQNKDPLSEESDFDPEDEIDFAALEREIAEDAADLESDAEIPEHEKSEEHKLAEKLLQDPKLMEKLSLIRAAMEQQKANANAEADAANSAPDPVSLPAEQMTSLRSQLRAAKKDPEHLIALRRLRVSLLPPHDRDPQLKSLNEALQLAYLGANDEVRRILWKAYIKAKSVPGLLEAIPDDAWDIIWYSQAVNWGSNANRENHMSMLRKDLAGLGRDGPPTVMED